jgi:hypothetical protein
MPKGKATGGAARPTGETAVRRYTAAEWAERERHLQHQAGLAMRPTEGHTVTLRVVHGAGVTRVSVAAHLPHPTGEGSAGQTIDLDASDEGVRELLDACERVLDAHAAQAEGAATLAWAQTLLAGEV